MAIAGVAAVGCTRSTDQGTNVAGDKIGAVGLKLVIAPGVTVNTVNYTISGNGFSRTGTIDVTGTQTTFTTTIGGIPQGNNYAIDLTATASDGSLGTGHATFNIIARTNTTVGVVLRFTPTTPTQGSVTVNGTTNVCPLVSLVTAVPQSIAAGSTSVVTGTASDANNAPSALTYSWAISPAGIGTLSSSTTLSPTFTAGPSAGTATLTLTVSDGDTGCPTAAGSPAVLAIQIAITGGGTAGTGAAGTGAAGTGAAGTGTAGTGTAGTGTAGTGTAGTGTAGTGTAGTGTAGTGTAGTGTAGTGTAGTGTAGTGTAGSGATACLTCEQQSHLVDDGSGTLVSTTSCPDALNGGLNLVGNTPALTDPNTSLPITGSGQSRAAVFQQIIDCFHTPHNGVICAAINPATGSAQETDCFCGIGVSSSTCFQNSLAQATGPCRDLVVAGAESTTVGTIANRFNDARFAIGAATTLVDSCDQVSCLQCLQ